MYPPEEDGERVQTTEGPGEFTGRTGQFDEHYEIDLDSGTTTYFHYEDITELHE